MWTCIAVTCSDSKWANAITEELSILNNQSLLNCQLSCVVLKDTGGTVSDGDKTLNALLVTVEKLCNNKGFENVLNKYLIIRGILRDFLSSNLLFFFKYRLHLMSWLIHIS